MIVLDTHAWLWWTSDPSRLSGTARAAIDRSDGVGVCTISCWELAMLVNRRRIALDRDVRAWIRHALAPDAVEPLVLTADIAVAAALVDADFGGDPADRIIYATARTVRAPLVTKDERLRSFDPRGTVW